jgi:hypothetical protein
MLHGRGMTAARCKSLSLNALEPNITSSWTLSDQEPATNKEKQALRHGKACSGGKSVREEPLKFIGGSPRTHLPSIPLPRRAA